MFFGSRSPSGGGKGAPKGEETRRRLSCPPRRRRASFESDARGAQVHTDGSGPEKRRSRVFSFVDTPTTSDDSESCRTSDARWYCQVGSVWESRGGDENSSFSEPNPVEVGLHMVDRLLSTSCESITWPERIYILTTRGRLGSVGVGGVRESRWV